MQNHWWWQRFDRYRGLPAEDVVIAAIADGDDDGGSFS